MSTGAAGASAPADRRTRGARSRALAPLSGPEGVHLRKLRGAPRRRQAAEPAPPVAALVHAPVEQRHHAVVALAADQPPEALLEGELRQRQVQTGEGRLAQLAQQV